MLEHFDPNILRQQIERISFHEDFMINYLNTSDAYLGPYLKSLMELSTKKNLS